MILHISGMNSEDNIVCDRKIPLKVEFQPRGMSVSNYACQRVIKRSKKPQDS